MNSKSNVPLLTGWVPNPKGVETWINAPENKHPIFGLVAPEPNQKYVNLLDYVLQVDSNWTRINQGIGDCVSHGFELAATILMAIQKVTQRRKFEGVAASEAIYGGARVESRGIKSGGWSDGAYGAAAAKWLQNWGVVVRKDYSVETSNLEHNLTNYDSKKAKNWGNYGCGGQGDGEILDTVARLHPVKTTSLVLSFEEAAAAISNGYPVPVCSNQGFTRQRDANGFCKPSGSWAHCMCFVGVRWDIPGLLCTNSWGKSNSGPVGPHSLQPAIADCSFWVDAKTATRMLSQWKDSFALSQFVGFKKQNLPNIGFTL